MPCHDTVCIAAIISCCSIFAKNNSPYWIVVEEKHNIKIIYDLKSVCSSIEINWGESHFLFTNAIFIQANEN